MPTFPTLSKAPVYPLSWSKEDNTIRTPFEAGYQQTRSRFTRTRRKWAIQYENLTSADAVLLDAFADGDDIDGATGSFTWVEPITEVSRTVRFQEYPKKSVVEWDGTQYLYNYEFVLVEV